MLVKKYIVLIGCVNDTPEKFEVLAHNQQEALDLVADYIVTEEFEDLYADHYEIFDLCEAGQTVDEYIEENALLCCGTDGIYLDVRAIYEVNGLIEDLQLEQTEQM